MNSISKLLLVLAASTTLGGCAVLDSVRGDAGKKNNTPTIGNRVDILGTERDTEADSALAGVSVILPEPIVNAAWAQPGGNASKSPGHVTLGQSLARTWVAMSQALRRVHGLKHRLWSATGGSMSSTPTHAFQHSTRTAALDFGRR